MEAINTGLDKAVFKKIMSINERMSFQNYIGIKTKEVGKNYAILQLTFGEDHANTAGIAHGGVTATLLDAAMGMAAFTTGKDVVTLEMKINFVAPGKIGSTVTAEGRVLHNGNRTVVTEGRIISESGEVLALATGTYFAVG